MDSDMPINGVMESFTRLAKHPTIKKESSKQRKIASLANSDGFKAMQEVIDTYIEELDNIVIDPRTDDPTSVGFRYLASRIARDYLLDLKSMPERYKSLLETKSTDNE